MDMTGYYKLPQPDRDALDEWLQSEGLHGNPHHVSEYTCNEDGTIDLVLHVVKGTKLTTEERTITPKTQPPLP